MVIEKKFVEELREFFVKLWILKSAIFKKSQICFIYLFISSIYSPSVARW